MADIDYNILRVSNENTKKIIPIKDFIVNDTDLNLYNDPIPRKIPWYNPEKNGLVMYKTAVDQDAMIPTVLQGDLHPIDVHYMIDAFYGDTMRESKIILRKCKSDHQYLIFTPTKAYLFTKNMEELKIPGTSSIMILTVPSIHIKLEYSYNPEDEDDPEAALFSIDNTGKLTRSFVYDLINIKRATPDPLCVSDPNETGPLIYGREMYLDDQFTDNPIFMLGKHINGSTIFPVYQTTPITNFRESPIMEFSCYDINGDSVNISDTESIFAVLYNRSIYYNIMDGPLSRCINWVTLDDASPIVDAIDLTLNPMWYLKQDGDILGLEVQAKIETTEPPEHIRRFMSTMPHAIDNLNHVLTLNHSKRVSDPVVIMGADEGELELRDVYLYKAISSKIKYPSLVYNNREEVNGCRFSEPQSFDNMEKHLLPSTEVGYVYSPETTQSNSMGSWKTWNMSYITAPPVFKHPYDPEYYTEWHDVGGNRYLDGIIEDTDGSLESNNNYVKLKRMELSFTGSRPYIYDDDAVAYQLAEEFSHVMSSMILVFKNGYLITDNTVRNFYISRLKTITYQGTYVYLDQKLNEGDDFYFVFDPNYCIHTIEMTPETQPYVNRGLFLVPSVVNYHNAVFYINGIRMTIGDGLLDAGSIRRCGPGVIKYMRYIGKFNNLVTSSVRVITPRSIYAKKIDQFYAYTRSKQKEASPIDFDPLRTPSIVGSGYNTEHPTFEGLVADPSAYAKYCILFEIIMKIRTNPHAIEKANLMEYLSPLKKLFPELTIKTLYENLFSSDRIVISGNSDGNHLAKFLITSNK